MLERITIEKTIGKTFADTLDTVLIEEFKITKRTMVEELGCANFIAAIRLGKVLKKLDIGTPFQLFRTDPISLVRVRGIGPASIFVAMCILDAAEYSVEEWWGWKATNRLKFSAFQNKARGRARKHSQTV